MKNLDQQPLKEIQFPLAFSHLIHDVTRARSLMKRMIWSISMGGYKHFCSKIS